MLRKKIDPNQQQINDAVSNFNKAVRTILDHIIKYEPRNQDLEYIITSISTLLRNAGPSIIIQSVCEKRYFDPYINKITNKDESFFLESNYQDEIKDSTQTKEGLDRWINFINRLKLNWKNKYNEETKELIWKNINIIINSYSIYLTLKK